MSEIEAIRKKRFQFLHTLMKRVGGDEFAEVSKWELGQELGFDRSGTQKIVQYLSGENLLRDVAIGGLISITHKGVVEVENALSHPEQPTEYFPPVMNIIHIQHMEGSQIQQGTTKSVQTGNFRAETAKDLSVFLDLLKEKLPELRLEANDESEMRADVATIESQLQSSRPKSGIIREALLSIQRMLEEAGGAIIAQQLAPYIPTLLAAISL